MRRSRWTFAIGLLFLPVLLALPHTRGTPCEFQFLKGMDLVLEGNGSEGPFTVYQGEAEYEDFCTFAGQELCRKGWRQAVNAGTIRSWESPSGEWITLRIGTTWYDGPFPNTEERPGYVSVDIVGNGYSLFEEWMRGVEWSGEFRIW